MCFVMEMLTGYRLIFSTIFCLTEQVGSQLAYKPDNKSHYPEKFKPLRCSVPKDIDSNICEEKCNDPIDYKQSPQSVFCFEKYPGFDKIRNHRIDDPNYDNP